MTSPTSRLLLLAIAMWFGSGGAVWADPFNASDPRAVPAMQKALAYLRKYNYSYRPVTGLVVYTLLVAEEPLDSPAVARGLDLLTAKFDRDTGIYMPTQHHLYEAGIDAMAFEKAGAEDYTDQLHAIVKYISGMQKEHGGWHYPNQVDTLGDSSISQYALLGLWAGERAGVHIPEDVLTKAASWLIRIQNADGGFPYHPQPTPAPNSSTATMSAACAGSLGIVHLLLFPETPVPQAPSQSVLKFGLLERTAPVKPGNKRTPPTHLREPLKKAIASVEQWLSPRFEKDAVDDHKGFNFYFYYALERAATIHGWSKLGNQDWYRKGVDVLLPLQKPDGQWEGWRDTLPADTCFALLFLMRSTQKLLPRLQTRPLGEGILAGGRGLPDDLTNVEFRNGRIRMDPKTDSFDQLLAGLSQVTLEETQQPDQPPLQVDLTQPEKLIGRVEELKLLARHPDPRARQMAAWALGRTDQVAGAEILIPLLKDPDIEVSIEARQALCWIARRPNGWGHPPDPRISPTGEEYLLDVDRKKSEWQTQVHRDWQKWFVDQRPYKLRDDFDDPVQKAFRGIKP
ncbi:MAG: HEAT repeat domain-containing protein [Planctomycetaceae bacterium]|nr:HEAT repeat domain-containing protein [Planctomycetaceae bacterium]